MYSVTFSEFRNSAKKYFDAVEKGESVQVYRKGKPVAIVMPAEERSLKRWKSALPLKLEGVSLSRAIISERNKA